MTTPMTGLRPAPTEPSTTQRLAWILGLAGLLPFAAQAVFSWVSPPAEALGVVRSQVQYAAVVLTFLGALHWGVTLAAPTLVDGRAAIRLVWGVLPAIYSWIVTLYSVPAALPLLGAGVLLSWVVDLGLYRATPVPRWFLTLRAVLTTGALLALLASGWALQARIMIPGR